MSDFWKTGFKPEDFGGLSREFWFPEVLERANEILFAELEKAPTTEICGPLYNNIDVNSCTHTAKLVAIEGKKRTPECVVNRE